MERIIKSRMESIDDGLDRPSTKPEVKVSVNNLLRKVRTARDYILADDAHENFALSYLKREAARSKKHDVEEYPNLSGERDNPVCYCKDGDCPLKEGILPTDIRNAETLDEGVLNFKRGHPGYPVVLDELTEEYHETRQIVEDILTIASIALDANKKVEELPDAAIDDAADTVSSVDDIEPVSPTPT